MANPFAINSAIPTYTSPLISGGNNSRAGQANTNPAKWGVLFGQGEKTGINTYEFKSPLGTATVKGQYNNPFDAQVSIFGKNSIYDHSPAELAAATGINSAQPVIFNPEAKPVSPVEGVNSNENQSVATAAWIASGGAPVDSLGTGFSQNLFGQQNIAGKRLQFSA